MQDISSKISSGRRGRRYIRSSSFVMAMLFTLLCGGASLSLGYFINYFTKGHLVHATEAVLDAEVRYIETVGADNAVAVDMRHMYSFLKGDGSLPDDVSSSISLLAEGIIVFDYSKNNRRYAAKIHTLPDNRKMLVGVDITDVSNDFAFMQALGIASIFFVMMVVFVSYVISIFVVSGTNKIADTAREIIDTGDLSRRVDVGSRWDDLGNMSVVLNMLLDRVQELMHGVRQVSDNIAHDLRTPLTRMRGHIEGLEDEHRDELLEEADQILDTFNALLRISRIESEKQRSQFADINLQALIQDVVEFYDPLAEERDIQLSVDTEDCPYNGDRDLLFQAYANLLDNAIKFTPQGGQVTVSLKREKGRASVRISDTGIGVSDDEKEKIFNRFYRSETCRSSAGTGLGLSLVSAVIGLHGGSVKVEDAHPGLSIITVL